MTRMHSITFPLSSLLPEPWRHRAQRLSQPCFLAALALFQILTEFFSSNIQQTLPVFSHWMRLGLMGLAGILLLAKFVFLTVYEKPWQFAVASVLVVLGMLSFFLDGDYWYIAVLLLVVAGKDVEQRRMLRVYFVTGALCLGAVVLLHWARVVPYIMYLRNYDFGFGHYNGYAGRLLGLFVAWMCLRFSVPRPKWYEGLIPLLLFIYCFFVVGARGASVTMVIIVCLMLVYRIFPRLFQLSPVQGLLVALCPLFLLCDLLCIRFFTQENPVWDVIDRFTSNRLLLLQSNARQYPIQFLGGNPTDTGSTTCLDNTFYAIFINKGILPSLVFYAAFIFFMYVLLKKQARVETCCFIGLLCYGLTENKLLQLTCNPMYLLMCGLLYYQGVQSFATLSVPASVPAPARSQSG